MSIVYPKYREVSFFPIIISCFGVQIKAAKDGERYAISPSDFQLLKESLNKEAVASLFPSVYGNAVYIHRHRVTVDPPKKTRSKKS